MIKITHPSKIISTEPLLTRSKSISNRMLIISALAEGSIEVKNLSDSDDTKILSLALLNLNHKQEINAGDAGTAFRFLTSLLSVTEGERLLSGSTRMNQRPVGPLVDALRLVGAEIHYVSKEGYPPLRIIGKKLSGGQTTIDGSLSSQFISSLMLIGPTFAQGLSIHLTGERPSWPYVEMTAELMKKCGVEVIMENESITIPAGKYTNGLVEVESDWSSASYWFEIAALSKEAGLVLPSLFSDSVQGDKLILEIMKEFGVASSFVSSGSQLRSMKAVLAGSLLIQRKPGLHQPAVFDFDFTAVPDITMTVAAVCAAKKIPARLRGLKNLVIKESDRLQSMKKELEKLPVEIDLESDSMMIKPLDLPLPERIDFQVHNDHRMAMSLAPISLLVGEVTIDDESVVRKSYPNFWEDLQQAGFVISS